MTGSVNCDEGELGVGPLGDVSSGLPRHGIWEPFRVHILNDVARHGLGKTQSRTKTDYSVAQSPDPRLCAASRTHIVIVARVDQDVEPEATVDQVVVV